MKFNDVLINSIGSLIAWIIWSVIIVIITFMIWSIIDIPGTYKEASIWTKTSAIFPIVFSIVTFIWTTICMYLTYMILNMTASEKYKKNIVILGQISFFAIMSYLFITPIYLYAGLTNYNYIMYVFLFHTIIISFGTSIILEVLNNYKHILISIYGSFIALFLSMILTILLFTSFESWTAKLISLVLLLPIINFLITFFKQIFELIYSSYNKYTNLDPLWDIFYQIDLEEKEKQREIDEQNSI